jgi:hypothetical protein
MFAIDWKWVGWEVVRLEEIRRCFEEEQKREGGK